MLVIVHTAARQFHVASTDLVSHCVVQRTQQHKTQFRLTEFPKKLRESTAANVAGGRGAAGGAAATQSEALPSTEFSSIAPVLASMPTSCFAFWLLITNE